MVQYISHLEEVASAPVLRFEQGDIRRYTIPFVLEWRFFLVERPDQFDRWTVFFFSGEELIVDFFRNSPIAHSFGQSDASSERTLTYTERCRRSTQLRLSPNKALSR